jgi:DNA-binding beta-propeller fold protein YncE
VNSLPVRLARSSLLIAVCAWILGSGPLPIGSPFRLLSSQPLDLICAYPAGTAAAAEGLAASSDTLDDAEQGGLPFGGRPKGGDVSPVRTVRDPYSTFAGIAVDPVNHEVVMSDENRFSLLVYDRTLDSAGVAEYRRRLSGPQTKIEFICGVTIDPVTREIYSVNNDTMDNMIVFGPDARGDVAPSRELKVDHGAWGVALDRKNDEVVITIQHLSKVAVYRRSAQGEEPTLRAIEGTRTGLADPHGVFIDTEHDELFVINQGAHRQRERTSPAEQGARRRGEAASAERFGLEPLRPSTGRFLPPSVRVFSRTATGDVAPLRVIEGPNTRLNLPQGIAVDVERDLIAVANDGGDSVLFFNRTAAGDVEPVYTLEGPATGLKNPSGIWIDTKHNELWVANWGDHSATVYSRTARGNVAPLRTIRSAPRKAATPGLGNPGAIAYDSKRDQLLVPN